MKYPVVADLVTVFYSRHISFLEIALLPLDLSTLHSHSPFGVSSDLGDAVSLFNHPRIQKMILDIYLPPLLQVSMVDLIQISNTDLFTNCKSTNPRRS